MEAGEAKARAVELADDHRALEVVDRDEIGGPEQTHSRLRKAERLEVGVGFGLELLLSPSTGRCSHRRSFTVSFGKRNTTRGPSEFNCFHFGISFCDLGSMRPHETRYGPACHPNTKLGVIHNAVARCVQGLDSCWTPYASLGSIVNEISTPLCYESINCWAPYASKRITMDGISTPLSSPMSFNCWTPYTSMGSVVNEILLDGVHRERDLEAHVATNLFHPLDDIRLDWVHHERDLEALVATNLFDCWTPYASMGSMMGEISRPLCHQSPSPAGRQPYTSMGSTVAVIPRSRWSVESTMYVALCTSMGTPMSTS